MSSSDLISKLRSCGSNESSKSMAFDSWLDSSFDGRPWAPHEYRAVFEMFGNEAVKSSLADKLADKLKSLGRSISCECVVAVLSQFNNVSSKRSAAEELGPLVYDPQYKDNVSSLEATMDQCIQAMQGSSTARACAVFRNIPREH